MKSPAPKARRFWPTLTVIFLADFATKEWAVSSLLPPGTPRSVLGNVLRFTLTYNDGGALGVDTGPVGLTLLVLLSCALILGLSLYYRSLPVRAGSRPFALALLVGGGLGNLLDRIGTRPGVVDFIDVGAGPIRFWTFNVADSAIFFGALWMAWWFWREPRPPSPCPGDRSTAG